jgi:hypothetical protein
MDRLKTLVAATYGPATMTSRLSLPPGDYLYTADVDLQGFMELISQIGGPPESWPS